MPYGLYISAEGAIAQNRRLETIANNLANVNTTGFKRDLALFAARYAEETAQGLDQPGSKSINDLGGGVDLVETKTDFSPGPLEWTGNEKNLAINGDGFFVVGNGGENFLTRAGNFVISPTGRLQTPNGHSVQADGGGEILIDPALPWTVTREGAIAQAGTITPLALAVPAAPGDLAKVGDNLFRPLAPTKPVDPSRRAVVAGFLEQSGVKPTSEMVNMIEASRAFEANVNLIRNQDQMMGTLVSRILRSNA